MIVAVPYDALLVTVTVVPLIAAVATFSLLDFTLNVPWASFTVNVAVLEYAIVPLVALNVIGFSALFIVHV